MCSRMFLKDSRVLGGEPVVHRLLGPGNLQTSATSAGHCANNEQGLNAGKERFKPSKRRFIKS